MIDESSSIASHRNGYHLQTGFIIDIVTSLLAGQIRSDTLRFGLVHWASSTEVGFTLWDTGNVVNYIERARLERPTRRAKLGGGTDPKRGIREMISMLNDTRVQADAPRFGILITDGQFSEEAELTRLANVAKQEFRTTLITIGIAIDKLQKKQLEALKTIASPSRNGQGSLAFNVATFDDLLPQLRTRVITTICNN